MGHNVPIDSMLRSGNEVMLGDVIVSVAGVNVANYNEMLGEIGGTRSARL